MAALPGRAGLPHEQQITGQNLNRNLKALETRERKTERAKQKGQERKIGVAKNDYLALDWGRETSLKNHLTSLKESPRNDKSAREKEGGREGMYVHVCVFEYLAL